MAKFIDGVDANSQRMRNVADPASATDAVTRSYADAHYAVVPARATATATSVSLASGAKDTSTSITLGKTYILYSIQTSRPARVEIYETAAQMASDASRVVGSDPASTAGVVFDFVTTVGGTTYSLAPLVFGTNYETVPSTSISMRVTNMDTVTGTVTVTFVFMRVE